MEWIANIFKDERSSLYYVDSEFIDFMETMGDCYEFTGIAIWARMEFISPKKPVTLFNKIYDLIYSDKCRSKDHWAFVARGTAIINSLEKHAFFISQFNDEDYISNDDTPIHEEGIKGSKPFLALFTDDKKTAALSIVPSSTTDVWVREKNNVEDYQSEGNTFVYKDGKLISSKLIENEWTLLDTPMKLRELNECIYKTPCSGKKYDLIENNSQHFVENLWLISLEYNRYII